MSTVHVQIEIDAPPQTVWETVMDPNRLGEWVTIHRSVKVKSPDPREQGARMDQVLHILGVSFKVHWTLESVVVPRQAEWHGRGPALSRALISYKLTANRRHHEVRLCKRVSPARGPAWGTSHQGSHRARARA